MIENKILAISGLTLQFIAFFLAAPEFLGHSWLKRMEEILKKIISKIPNVLFLLTGILAGFLAGRLNVYYIISSLILSSLILYKYKSIEKWVNNHIATPLLNKLIVREKFRFTLFKIAAICISLGFIFQVISILIQ